MAGALGETLLDRAAWYRTMALLFRDPDAQTLESLRESVAGLNAALVDHDGRERLRRFSAALDAADTDSLRREHSRLFAGAGLCRLNEMDYEPLSFAMTQRLADVAGFYEAFGFENDPAAGERPDFVGAELEFALLLLLKEAYALEQGWTEQAGVTREAAGRFVNEHLLNWLPQLCGRLSEVAAETPVLRAGAELLEAFARAERHYAGEEPGA